MVSSLSSMYDVFFVLVICLHHVYYSLLREAEQQARALIMSDGAFYLVTVSGGTVVEKTGTGIFDKTAEAGNKAQQWTIEYEGDNESKVAFKNASDGTFLRATSGAAYGKLECAATKQYWTLEKGGPNGTVW